jgi:CHASE2 domain-containing sensor protein
MSWLNTVWSELIGLFVDDGRFAIVIVLWLGACWLALPHLELPPPLPPAILFAGLVVILVESAMRLARTSSRKDQ